MVKCISYCAILSSIFRVFILHIYVIASKENTICNDICLFVKIFKNKQKYCPIYSTAKRTIIATRYDTISLFFLSLSRVKYRNRYYKSIRNYYFFNIFMH